MTPLLWALTLLVVSIGFIILEVFLPSGGLLGLMAAAAAVAAVVIVFYCEGLAVGTGFLVVTLVSFPLATNFAIKWWPYTPLGRRILNLAPGEKDIVTAVPDFSPLMELVGQRGMSISKMIPSGSVTIAGQHYDAISQSGAISEGQAIKVVAVDGTRILVRELEPDELNADPGKDSSAATGPDRLIPDPFDE